MKFPETCPKCGGPVVHCLPPKHQWYCFRCDCFWAFQLEPTSSGNEFRLEPVPPSTI